jgi:hypothetical protein
MGFYIEPKGRRAVRGGVVKVRVSDSLGATNPYLTAINAKYGTSIGVTAPAPTYSPTVSAPLPTPTAPAPIPTVRTFSPAVAPTPTPTYAPPPPSSTPYNEPVQPPPNVVDTAAGAAQAAAPIITAAAGPAAGAAAAMAPAFANAFNAPSTTKVQFDDSMPDLSLPAVFNPDGTPATPAAAATTLADKIKALPTAAKIGGAVLLYLFFSRR